jgi:hypothetical protein
VLWFWEAGCEVLVVDDSEGTLFFFKYSETVGPKRKKATMAMSIAKLALIGSITLGRILCNFTLLRTTNKTTKTPIKIQSASLLFTKSFTREINAGYNLVE